VTWLLQVIRQTHWAGQVVGICIVGICIRPKWVGSALRTRAIRPEPDRSVFVPVRNLQPNKPSPVGRLCRSEHSASGPLQKVEHLGDDFASAINEHVVRRLGHKHHTNVCPVPLVGCDLIAAGLYDGLRHWAQFALLVR
jgi:hypothetical protein